MRARSSASRSDSVRMWTTPERRPCGSGPPSRSMSTSSPVTERTTSGPVTKIRPSGPRITTSVSAGPYAAPPAAGPSTTEICGILPEAWVIAWKIRPTACSESTPSASRAPPECQSPMIGSAVGDRAVVGVDDDPAAHVAHRAAHDGRVGAERHHRRAVDRADRGEHAGVVVGRDQLERALVEQRGEPVDRVARVLLAGQLGGLGRRWRHAVAVTQYDPKATATLAPPKPKELLSAAMSPTGRSRGLVAMSSSTWGSWSSRLIVGGTTRWCDREDGRDRLERAGAAEQVAGHRLGAGDHDLVDVRAERRVQHQPLGDVALRGRGRVRVDVDDRLRARSRTPAAPAGSPGSRRGRRVGLGDVVGVGGDAGAEHLGVDPGAAGLGVLLGLEHQHAGALAEHEAVAGGVPGPGDRGRVAAGVLGQRHHVGERRHRQRVDRRLGAAGDDDVGAAEPDLVERERDAPRCRTRRPRPGC